MKTNRKTIVTALCGLAFSTLLSASVVAAPKALLVAPGEPYGLPKFGFSSSTIEGYGERVLSVRPYGRAARLGLERGDIILTLNGYPLTYRGAWNNALADAVADGGFVQLRIRDVRTGRVVRRELFLGSGNGPVEHYTFGSPFNATPHSHRSSGNITIKDIAKLIEND
jgi:hypothetical protein